MDFFWNLFKKSGNIEAYLGYKNAQSINHADFKEHNVKNNEINNYKKV